MKNYTARLINNSAYGMERRNVGDIIYAYIYDDGKVLLYSPSSRKLPVFDVILDSINEAKNYATCISVTDFDIKASFDQMIDRRYW